MFDTLRQAQGGGAMANIARAFNIDPRQAEAAIASIMPELSRAIERNTLSHGGLADLVKALGSGHHQRYLDDPAALASPAVRAEGDAILGHLLGEKDKSRGVAARASTASGLPEAAIKQMLPYVAAMAMGGLARQTRVGFGDILSRLPNLGGVQAGGQGQGFPLPMPGQRPQQPSKAQGFPGQQMPLPDQGGFGSGGGFGGGGIGNQMPLPVPGDPGRGGYGGGGGWGGGMPGGAPQGRKPLDDLSDILRRGAGAGDLGGGILWNIVRSVLGGAMGFNTGGGVMGWIFRAVILRYGWSILGTIFRRVLLGR